MTYALGIMCHGWHESAAALVRNGTVVAAAEEERFTRRKLDSRFPSRAISFCLEQAGIRPAQLSAVGFGFDLSRKRLERARHVLRYLPGSLDFVRTRMPMARRMANVKDEIRAFLRFNGPIYTFNHHLCHAASTFYSSPFETAAILTMDGAGDWESCWWGHGSGSDLRELGTIDWPLSLGHIYAAVTEYCGFKAFHDEYKVMGLAAYGRPALMEAMRKVFWPTESGFDVDLNYFTFHLGRVPRFSGRFVSTFGPPLTDPGSGIPDPYRDLAASAQRQLEEVILHLARKVLALTGESRLCLAGGVALNAVANGRIARETGIESLYVPPCASDAGCALGAAYLGVKARQGTIARDHLRSALLGPAYDDERILAAMTAAGLSPREIDDPAQTAAEMVAAGKVVGWFDGRMEFGQRALGARSILGDPRDERMKDIINAKVKFREPFRPFAPSVLEERVTDYFACRGPTPFMTETYPVLNEKKPVIPAVVHVDGTARIQTVSREQGPSYRRLIESFERITGVPVVLNTSFNTREEPIVNTPEEAVAAFQRTALDVLVAGGVMATKE